MEVILKEIEKKKKDEENEPSGATVFVSLSAFFASSLASSNRLTTTALRVGLTRCICSINRLTSCREVTWPVLILCASETPDSSNRGSEPIVMAGKI